MDEAVVSCPLCPFFCRIDVIVEIYCLVCLELVVGHKWRYLQVDSLGCAFFLAGLGTPGLLLFLLLVLRLDDLDSEGPKRCC